MPDNLPKIIDIFCGAGGLSLGATRAGFSLLGAVDNDERSIQAHSINFPNCTHWRADLSELNGKELSEYFNLREIEIDGIIGGPPCQGFSSIGRNNDGDPRNKLFISFFKIVRECKPKFFLAENVPGILNGKHKGTLNDAFSFVNDYVILPPLKLKASDYGAPTSRIRIFFFGYLPKYFKELNESIFNAPKDIKKIVVREALKGLPRKINPQWQTEEKGWRKIRPSINGGFGSRLYGSIPDGVGDEESVEKLKKERRVSGCIGTRHSKEVQERYAGIQNGKQDKVSKSRRLEANGYCHTLRAGTGSDHGSYQAVRPLHPSEDRVITPREAARLQGFPDWFRFDATKWHSFRQIGNSVSPILAEMIFKIIKRSMLNGGR